MLQTQHIHESNLVLLSILVITSNPLPVVKTTHPSHFKMYLKLKFSLMRRKTHGDHITSISRYCTDYGHSSNILKMQSIASPVSCRKGWYAMVYQPLLQGRFIERCSETITLNDIHSLLSVTYVQCKRLLNKQLTYM